MPMTVNPAWLDARRALHVAFEDFCTPPDSSWLAHLGRPEQGFTTDDIRGMWAALPTNPATFAPVNHVYLHVPFCKSICHFCNYERLRPSSPDLMRRWKGRVLEALEALAPALEPHWFHSLYVGGGTPSTLPASMLRDVVGALDRTLRFHPFATRYFEMDPAVMSDAKMAALRDLGFKHVSFGVQTLDPAVNVAHDRGPQDRALVAKRFAELKASDILFSSCDFLLGLAGTTPDGIFAEIEEVIEAHQPRWVDIYHLTPTDEYVDKHFGGDEAAFWAHIQPFQDVAAQRLRQIAEKTDYHLHLGDSHHHSLQARHQGIIGHTEYREFSYSQLLADQDRPLSLLGLGTSARSRIFGQGQVEFRDPGDDVGAEGPATWWGKRMDLPDEAREYLIYRLRDHDSIDRARFLAIFGRDVVDLFPRTVAAWEALGIATADAETLRLVPQARRDRMRALFWAVPAERLEWEVARHRGLDLHGPALKRRLHPLKPGQAVGGGWTLAGVEHARVRLTGHGAEAVLRVAPDLAPDAWAPRLVVEAAPASAEARAGLRRAVPVVRKVLAASSAG